MSTEEFGADRWVAHHTETVARLEALIAILDDPSIAPGTPIQVGAPGAPSRIRSAAVTRGLLPLARDLGAVARAETLKLPAKRT
jgi:hypothetical protein